MKRHELLGKYRDYLIFRNYRPNTIESYYQSIEKFLLYCIDHSELGEDIRDYAKPYLTGLFKKGLSWSSVNVSYSALRLLFVHVMDISWDYEFIPRPRGKASIATVPSGREVERMLNALDNIKHKCVLLMLYSTGVRIQELINIDLRHINMDRGQLKIVKGKGGKDRIVKLAPTTLKMLEIYIRLYKPQEILFEGLEKGCRYSSSSINKIIRRISKKVGLHYNVTAHTFRHAYATHHIENGTNLVNLKEQLGHKDINTTIKYIKLCKTNLHQIHHPIERLRIHLEVHKMI